MAGGVGHLGEALENPLVKLGRNAGAVVPHAYLQRLAGLVGGAHQQAGPARGVADGISQQVDEHPGGFFQVGAGQGQGGGQVGFEAQLWKSADALRNNMDAAEYKHVVLGLIFLKYISDAFEEVHGALVVESKNGADPEDKEEYRALNVFLRAGRRHANRDQSLHRV